MSAQQSTTNEPDGEGDSSFSDSNKLLDDNQLQNSSSSPLHCPEHEENSNAEQQQSPSEQNPSTTINVDNNCATANETEQSIENSQFQVQVGSTALLIAGILTAGTAFLKIHIPTEEGEQFSIYFGVNIFSLVSTVLTILTGATGIIAGWFKSLRAAQLYFLGLIALISCNLVFLFTTLIVTNYVNLINYDYIMFTAYLLFALFVTCCCGIIFNSPCLCCLYCSREYKFALDDMEEDDDSEEAQNEGDQALEPIHPDNPLIAVSTETQQDNTRQSSTPVQQQAGSPANVPQHPQTTPLVYPE